MVTRTMARCHPDGCPSLSVRSVRNRDFLVDVADDCRGVGNHSMQSSSSPSSATGGGVAMEAFFFLRYFIFASTFLCAQLF